MMKTTRHSLMAKGILVLLSLLILIFVFTYSWFMDPDTPATASGISLTTSVDGDFEYAIGFSNSQTFGGYVYTDFTHGDTSFNLKELSVGTGESAAEYNLLYDYTPIDVTGDGATLIRPSMAYGNSRINVSSTDYSLAEPNVQYISFDLIFRSTTNSGTIKLGNGSYAVGACEIKTGTISDVGNSALTSSSACGVNGYNVSDYGDFSKDAIVGAVRIAFVPYETGESYVTGSNVLSNTSAYLSDEACLLWLPRPDIYLNSNSTNTGWTLSTGLTASTAKNDANGVSRAGASYLHQYYNIFTANGSNSSHADYHKIVDYDNVVVPDGTTHRITTNQIASISESISREEVVEEDTETYYYSKVNVRIWIDGTDAEARRALSKGRFSVNFHLTTMG